MKDCNHIFETLEDGTRMCFECDHIEKPEKSSLTTTTQEPASPESPGFCSTTTGELR